MNQNSEPAPPQGFSAATDWLSTYPSLSRVAMGLGMIYVSIVITMLYVIGGLISVLFFHKQPPFALAAPYKDIWIFHALEFLTIIGALFCWSTPSESGATTYIVSSTIFMLASIGINLAANFFYTPLEKIGINIIAPVLIVPWIVSQILFVLYLRKLALFLNAPKLVIAARKVLIAAIIFGGLFLAMFHFIFEIYNLPRMRLPQDNPPALGLVLASSLTTLACMIVGLYLLVKCGNLLSNLRKTIRSGRS
jgi:hypothetical protein